MKRIKEILSYSPVISFTDDENFGEIKNDTKKCRFSLLRFSLGVQKFYFLTYLDTEGFKLFKKLSLYNIQKEVTNKESLDKSEEYAHLISSYKHEDIDVHVAALQYKMSQLENTMDVSLNKLMFYYAILMGLISAIIAWIMNSRFMWTTFFIQIIITYCLVNILLFSMEFIRIKGWPRFAFHDLKSNEAPKKKFAESIYYEWYFTRNRVPICVSCIKNIEKYFGYIALIGCLLAAFLFFGRSRYLFKPSRPEMLITAQDFKSSLMVNLSLPLKDILNEQNVVVLRKVQDSLAANEYSHIILARTINAKTEVYNDILKQLMFYNVDKASFIEIVFTYSKDNEANLLTIIPIRRNK